jgi:hypothetical protein
MNIEILQIPSEQLALRQQKRPSSLLEIKLYSNSNALVRLRSPAGSHLSFANAVRSGSSAARPAPADPIWC